MKKHKLDKTQKATVFWHLDNRQHKTGMPARKGVHKVSPSIAPALRLGMISPTAEQRARVWAKHDSSNDLRR